MHDAAYVQERPCHRSFTISGLMLSDDKICEWTTSFGFLA